MRTRAGVGDRALRWGALLALGVAWVGCLPDFAPASQLGDAPQVLVIRASAPEVAPGAEVRLDALVHWPSGAPDYLWLVCVPRPGDEIDTCVTNRIEEGEWPLSECAGDAEDTLCWASRDATALFTVPAELPLGPDEVRTLYVELLVGVDAEGAACWQALSALDPSPECLVGLKRLRVSRSASPNVNPALAGLLVDGETVDATGAVVLGAAGADPEDLRVSLSVEVDPASVDELTRADEPVSSVRLPVAWYSTCGELDDDEGRVRCEAPASAGELPVCEPAQTRWRPRASGECTVHVVLRDPDGGADYRTQRFLITSGG